MVKYFNDFYNLLQDEVLAEKNFDKKKIFKFGILSGERNNKILAHKFGQDFKGFLNKLENQKRKRLNDCGNYITIGDKKDGKQVVEKANFCRQKKLCLLCAVRSSIKLITKIKKRFEAMKEDLIKYNCYYITIPIKHTIKDSFEDLLEQILYIRRELLKNGKRNVLKGAVGGFCTIEITITKNGYNVHLNMLLFTTKKYDLLFGGINKYKNKTYFSPEIREFVKKTTKRLGNESYRTTCQPIDISDEANLVKILAELTKYNLKVYSKNVSIEQQLEIAENSKSNRFFSTFGCFYGFKEEVEYNEPEDEIVKRYIFKRYVGKGYYLIDTY